MTKIRKGKSRDGGLLTVAGMSLEFAESHSRDEGALGVAQVLANLLNGADLAGDRKERVVEILRLLGFQKWYQSYLDERMRSPGSQSAKTFDDPVYKLSIEALSVSDARLNEILTRYRVTPQISGIFTPEIRRLAGSGGLYFVSLGAIGDREETSEIAAVMGALQLADRGQIDSVRECSCGVFFVPRRIDQRYHKTECRVKAHQSSEEFKVERRKKDRKRYQYLHRDGKVKEGKGEKHVTQKAR
jgi:hypothetical protein